LRNDVRVKVIDRMNARYLTRQIYANANTEPATFACIDVSFISITKILPALKSMTADDACAMELVCLVKPQFEAGRDAIGKGGVVKSSSVHMQVLAHVIERAEQLGFTVLGGTHSPIKGPAGNIEFLLHMTTHSSPAKVLDLLDLVRQSGDLL
jgi:23S rRNA (cytidine1920-2'-O)/16S rRNA (cytidine1409-2'-O)-methyltransferase